MFDDGPLWGKPKTEQSDDWLLTYADAATLLLAFFIMLVGISTINPILYEKVKEGMAEHIGKRVVAQPLNELKSELVRDVAELAGEEAIGISEDEHGLVMEFASNAFYAPGSATIREEGQPILQRIAETLSAATYIPFRLEVEGHTDDTPIQTQRFPSNWELSADRASAVVRLFADSGIEPARMRAIGYADVIPKAPNRDMEGRALPRNQAINRRVAVRILPR